MNVQHHIPQIQSIPQENKSCIGMNLSTYYMESSSTPLSSYQVQSWNSETKRHQKCNLSKFNHQNMIALISTTVMCSLKQCKTRMK